MQLPESLQDQAVNLLLVRLASTNLASGRCPNAMDMPGWQMESSQGHLRQQWHSQGRLLGGRGSGTDAGGGGRAGRTVAGRRVCWAEGRTESAAGTSRSLNPERPLGQRRQCEWPERRCSTDMEMPPSCPKALPGRVVGAQPGAPGAGGPTAERTP